MAAAGFYNSEPSEIKRATQELAKIQEKLQITFDRWMLLEAED